MKKKPTVYQRCTLCKMEYLGMKQSKYCITCTDTRIHLDRAKYNRLSYFAKKSNRELPPVRKRRVKIMYYELGYTNPALK